MGPNMPGGWGPGGVHLQHAAGEVDSGEGLYLMPPPTSAATGPSHWQKILRCLQSVPGQTNHTVLTTVHPTCRPQAQFLPAAGLWRGLLRGRLPAPWAEPHLAGSYGLGTGPSGSGRYLHRLHTSTRQSLPPERKWLLSPVNCRQEMSW